MQASDSRWTSTDADLGVVAARFADSTMLALPVIDARDQLRGVVLAIEVERAVHDRAAGVTAADLAQSVPLVSPDDGLETALSALSRNGGDGLPVADRSCAVTGWFTHRDPVARRRRRRARPANDRSRCRGPQPSLSGPQPPLSGGVRVHDPIVHTHGLTKRFGSTTAVQDLSLSLYPGRILGFLGPNGAGKTTTIRILMGMLRPTSGRATVLGKPAGDVATRRRIGYLPGDLRVDPRLTGTDLFAWFARLRGQHEPDLVAALCDRLGLDPSRRFGALSKGNRQKVGIIQALSHRPELLILDEPTTGLDPIAQREFLVLLRETAARGAAVLFSSHVLPEVEHAATDVAIIRGGRLVTYAAVADLLDRARRRIELRYASPPATAAFDGVPGVVDVNVDGATLIVTIDGPVGPALRAATDAGMVQRVMPVDDDLENLFMTIYSDRGDRIEVH